MIKTLGEICRFYAGTGFPKKYQGLKTGKYPFIKVGDISNNVSLGYQEIKVVANYVDDEIVNILKGIILPKNTIIFAKIGEAIKLNRRALTSQDSLVDNNVMGIKGDINLISPTYLYYFLCAQKLDRFAEATTVPSLKRSTIAKIKIDIPSTKEQHQRLDKLRLIDYLIKIKYSQLEKLDLLIKSRFVEMFGDPIQLNHCNYSMEPMPKVCTIIDGDRGKNYPHDNDFSPEGYCLFLNTKNVTSSGFNFDHITFITKKKDLQLRKGKLNYGDVILTTRGTIGNLAYYSRDIPFSNVRINSGMVILRLNHELMNERFFMSQFKLKLPYILDNISSGSAQPQLPISTMDKIMMIVPPLELQENYAEFCKQIDKSRLAVQKSLDELEILKKSLMQQYFG